MTPHLLAVGSTGTADSSPHDPGSWSDNGRGERPAATRGRDANWSLKGGQP